MSEKFCKPTPERQQLLKEELGRQFRIISEEAACSLWAYKIGDELPPLLIEGAAKQHIVNYQGVKISPVYSEWLVSLATELGHWVNQGRSERYIPYVPKSLRLKRHDREVLRLEDFTEADLESIRKAEPPAESAGFDSEVTG